MLKHKGTGKKSNLTSVTLSRGYFGILDSDCETSVNARENIFCGVKVQFFRGLIFKPIAAESLLYSAGGPDFVT